MLNQQSKVAPDIPWLVNLLMPYVRITVSVSDGTDDDVSGDKSFSQ